MMAFLIFACSRLILSKEKTAKWSHISVFIKPIMIQSITVCTRFGHSGRSVNHRK